MASEPTAQAAGDATAGTDGPGHRLHSWSWLFVLLTQLRNVMFPLVALLFFGRGEWWELMPVVAAVGLALHAFLYSLSFRYWLRRDELVVREGLFDRTERHVPYQRIQNVAQRRNVLHRLFGVTELRLESAGGAKPEAVMNVVTVAAAAELEAFLRSRGDAPAAALAAGHGPTEVPVSGAGRKPADPPRVLFTLPFAERVRFGLISNRGLVLLGAAFAFLAQADVDFRRFPGMSLFNDFASEWVDGHGTLSLALTGALALLGALVLLRVFSVLLALITFHDFRLEQSDGRLVAEQGLFTRVRAGAGADKIQRVDLVETVLHRAFDRLSVRVSVAAGGAGSGEGNDVTLRYLAPLLAPAKLPALLAAAQPGLDFANLRWQGLHPRAVRRYAKEHFVVLAAVIGAGWLVVGAWSLLGLALVPLIIATARGYVRTSGWAVNDTTFAVRLGWVRRRTTVLRLAKIQSVRQTRSPFDRRAGMASLTVDLAGSSGAGAVEVPYLAVADAERLFWVFARAAANAGRGQLPPPQVVGPGDSPTGLAGVALVAPGG